jgi:hypothetical protein
MTSAAPIAKKPNAAARNAPTAVLARQEGACSGYRNTRRARSCSTAKDTATLTNPSDANSATNANPRMYAEESNTRREGLRVAPLLTTAGACVAEFLRAHADKWHRVGSAAP